MLLVVICLIITLTVNFGNSVYPSKYTHGDDYIDFSSNNTYTTSNSVGLYHFNEAHNAVILDNGNVFKKQSVFVLYDNRDNAYVSAAAITWQVIAVLLVVGAIVYVGIVFRVD